MPRRLACLVIAVLLLMRVGDADAAHHHKQPSASDNLPSAVSCTINGVVHNRRDQLVQNAVIKIYRRHGGGKGHLDAQQRSGSMGTFSFQRAPGQFRVVATHKPDGHAVVFIHTVANQVFNLELSLYHDPPCCGHSHFHLGTGGIH
jgi:hypothetical protein